MTDLDRLAELRRDLTQLQGLLDDQSFFLLDFPERRAGLLRQVGLYERWIEEEKGKP